MGDYKSIAVRPETYERFKRFGKYGDNMDDVLIRLLNISEKAKELADVIKKDGEAEDKQV